MTNPNPFDKYYDDPLYSFFISQLLETGLSPEANQFIYEREGKANSAMYMSPDKEGNVRFVVPDIITGDLETYVYGKAPHIKIRDWYLIRWIKPLQTAYGPAKYTPVKSGGTRLLFTRPVADAFKSKKQIKTLFIIEGFKKALSAAENGKLPMVGMNGLTGFKEPDSEPPRIRSELRQVILDCKVQRVVVIFDNDLFLLGKSKDKPASQRPNQFYRAALMARILIEPFADVFLAYPNPHPSNKYGLDDLLLEHRNSSNIKSPLKLPENIKFKPITFPVLPDNQKKIIKDLLVAIENHNNVKSIYFEAHKLSAMADYKIKQIFHLENVQAFYEFYREILRKKDNQRFQYYTHLYQIQGDGTLAETEADSTSYLNIESKFGKLVRQTDKGEKHLANFTMKVLFQIDSEDDPKRICEITNYEGNQKTIEINSKTFIGLSDFQALMIGFGDFIWKGTKDDLLDLMSILFKHEKPATLVSQLGWQPLDNFYAFSNGIVTKQGFLPVDQYGMVVHNETNYYFPAWSKFNARDYDTYKDVKRFSHFTAKKPVTFITWSRLFTTVYGDAGKIAITYFAAALFSDIIFYSTSGRGFPLLWSAGKPKTGKSTICTSILAMFGQPSEAIGLAGKSTIKYFINRFAQYRNGLVHLDEYSNTKVGKDVKETLKNIYDRIGYGRKAFSNDFRTISTPILSGAMVSGEEIPTDNHALFTRAILLLFNKDKFTTKERQDFSDLRTMEEASLTHLTVEILRHRTLMEEYYADMFQLVFDDFYQRFKNKPHDDRMLKNASWIVSIIRILMDHAKFDFGFSYTNLLDVFEANIERQNQYMAANTDITKFWDIIEMLFARKEISEDKGDFRFVNNLLAIRLNRLHIPYSLEARKLGYEKILDKSTLQNYLTNEPYFVEVLDSKGKPKQIRFNGSSPTSTIFLRYNDMDLDLRNDQPMGKEETDDDILNPHIEAPKSVLPKTDQMKMGFVATGS